VLPALTRISATAAIAVALLPADALAQTPPTQVTLTATFRDFRGWDLPANEALGLPQGHEDFENASGMEKEIVTPALGEDGKPVYAKVAAPSLTTHGQAAFDQWYRDVPGVNLTHTLPLTFVRQSDGRFHYSNDAFFPLDNLGWVALGPEYEQARAFGHNYSFTTELRAEFRYTGEETVTFIGDDDVFLYVNGRLVLDLGGVHGPQGGDVVLAEVADTLGLEEGEVYDLDLFHAERHTIDSNFTFKIPEPGFPPGTATLPASARVGDTITCAVAGWPQDAALSYTWLRDGTAIPGADGATLTLTAADAARELSCRVTATRRTSSIAESAPLRVSEAPPAGPGDPPGQQPGPDPQPGPGPQPGVDPQPGSDPQPGGSAVEGDRTKPKISQLKLQRVQRVKGKKVRRTVTTLDANTYLSLRLSEAASVTVTLRTLKKPKVTRKLTVSLKAGTRTIPLRALFKGRRLKGSVQLSVAAADEAGNVGTATKRWRLRPG
jgi:fibro-slime domain-containing protein